jgi:hypothetical protein
MAENIANSEKRGLICQDLPRKMRSERQMTGFETISSKLKTI